MSQLTKRFSILARDFSRAGEVSIQVQGILKKIGYDQDIIRRASICAYESELNVVMYGGGGHLHLTVGPDEIILDVVDEGPGIEDIELAMQEGYSTAPAEYQELGFGAGMGLPNIKRNSDSLEIVSDKGKGTHLKIGFKVR
jgi:anti-sigma regulatory factor (Ser/Thr protein kinase)